MKRAVRILAALGGLCLAAPLGCTQIAGLDTSYVSAIDAPCQSDDDCGSGVCISTPGWCTQTCTGDADCPEGVCVENKNDVDVCFPACSSDSDCSVYGAVGVTCQAGTSVDGIVTSVCTG